MTLIKVTWSRKPKWHATISVQGTSLLVNKFCLSDYIHLQFGSFVIIIVRCQTINMLPMMWYP